MKKRMVLMAIAAMMVLTTTAQTQMDALNDQLASSLSRLFDTEAQALQPDSVTPDGEWQKVMETQMTAKDSYKYARSVLARMIPNYQQRVKLEDEKDAKIICDVALELLGSQRVTSSTELLKGIHQMTMTLVFKDNRYRVKVEGVTCTYRVSYMGATMDWVRGEAFRTTNIKTKGGMQNDMKQKAGEFMKAFSKALVTQKADDDF